MKMAADAIKLADPAARARTGHLSGILVSIALAVSSAAPADPLAREPGKRPSDPLLDEAQRLVENHKAKRALLLVKEALRKNPNNARAFIVRGEAHEELENFQDSIADIDRGIKLDPKAADWLAYAYRAKAHCSLEQWQAGVDDDTKAIALAPKDVKEYNYRQRGETYFNLHQYDKALKDMDMAVKLGPDDVDNWICRGNAHEHLHHYEKAVADFTRAIEMAPYVVRNYGYRGGVYEKMGKHDLAAKDMAKANEGYMQMVPDSKAGHSKP